MSSFPDFSLLTWEPADRMMTLLIFLGPPLKVTRIKLGAADSEKIPPYNVEKYIVNI